MKFKNPPDAPESFLLGASTKKPRGLGCRGDANDLEPSTSHKLGTSVDVNKVLKFLKNFLLLVSFPSQSVRQSLPISTDC